jgi:uncharacterized protein involved in type VI secretion and phage assembly
MPVTLYDTAAEKKKSGRPEAGVYTGTVVNNCDPKDKQKIVVRIPALDQEVSARLSAPGGGQGAGFYYVPRIDDEVLVLLNDNDPVDACIISGLYNNIDTPPVSNPLEITTKRVIKTGLKGGIGHEVEFDDGPGQSITISTTTKQKIVIDPFKMEFSNAAGSLKITMDNKTQSIKIEALNSIELTASTIKINGLSIDVGDIAKTVKTTIKGKLVQIN